LPEFTDDQFRDFVKLVQQAALEAYPNPDRVGCPDPELLRAIAIQQWPSDHPVFRSHIAQCSPCIAAVLEERRRFQGDRKKHRQRLFAVTAAASAAVCLLIVGLIVANSRSKQPVTERAANASAQHQPTTPSPSPSEPPRQAVVIALDIRSASPTRSDRGAAIPLFSVPAALANLRLTLPVGSDDGPYELTVQAPGGQTVLSTHGNATITAGTTVLNAQLDLSRIDPGEYVLYYRHANQAGHHRISLLVSK
jgi:hypothetical protein